MDDNIRKCFKCNNSMFEGYIYNGETYCCKKCLPISEKQFNKEYTNEGDNCWTEWESIYLN